MALHIDVGEIIIDGVKLTENQLFELRLALESELTSARTRTFSRNMQSSSQVDLTSDEVHPNSSPGQIASGIVASIFEMRAPEPRTEL